MIPSSCLIAKSVNSKSEPSHVANDITGEVKEHVFGKTVGRMMLYHFRSNGKEKSAHHWHIIKLEMTLLQSD